MTPSIWFTVIFFAILTLLSFVHVRVNDSFKIETPWVAVALAPAVIWLVLSGQLSELTFLGVNLKVREASSRAYTSLCRALPRVMILLPPVASHVGIRIPEDPRTLAIPLSCACHTAT